MNVLLGEFLGFLSGFCLSISFIPQAIKIIKTKDVKGISILSYIVYNIGIVTLILYGFYLKSFQIMFFNTISEIFAFIILYTTIKYKNKK